jgi:acyl-CoA reductase-like NAD-dependent aldehyde dehydrogenase
MDGWIEIKRNPIGVVLLIPKPNFFLPYSIKTATNGIKMGNCTISNHQIYMQT